MWNVEHWFHNRDNECYYLYLSKLSLYFTSRLWLSMHSLIGYFDFIFPRITFLGQSFELTLHNDLKWNLARLVGFHVSWVKVLANCYQLLQVSSWSFGKTFFKNITYFLIIRMSISPHEKIHRELDNLDYAHMRDLTA